MLLRTKIELATASLALGGAVLLGRTLLSEHDARLVAESKAAVISQTQQQDRQQVQALADLINQVKTDNAKQVASLADAVKNLRTPNDQLAWVVSQLKAQQPISINVPPNPNNPATISVPQVDIPGIVQTAQDCKTCQLNLSSTQQQLTYKDQQMQKLANDLLGEQQKTKDLQVAVKGGTTWQRFKRALKWASIGGGAAITLACASGHCK